MCLFLVMKLKCSRIKAICNPFQVGSHKPHLLNKPDMLAHIARVEGPQEKKQKPRVGYMKELFTVPYAIQ